MKAVTDARRKAWKDAASSMSGPIKTGADTDLSWTGIGENIAYPATGAAIGVLLGASISANKGLASGALALAVSAPIEIWGLKNAIQFKDPEPWRTAGVTLAAFGLSATIVSALKKLFE